MKASAKQPKKPESGSLSYLQIAHKAMRRAQQKAIKEDIFYGLKPALAEKKAKSKKAG